MKIGDKLRDIFLSSIITLTATLLTLLLKFPVVKGLERHWIYSVLVACGAGAIFLVLNKLIFEIREENRRSRETQQLERQTNALPSFVVMKDRIDHFTFDHDGGATLDWSFDIDRGLSDAETTEILFPIFAELEPGQQPFRTAVKVEAFSVDGAAMNLKQVYIPMETRQKIQPQADGIGQRMEFGMLKIPLRFEPGRTRRKIKLKLRLEKSFTNLTQVEFVYVDVPILTERLTAILESSTTGRISSIPFQEEQTLTATLGMVDTPDPGETHAQRNRWRQSEDGKLVWTTEYPKLGYRYKLRFRLDDDGFEAADQPGPAAPTPA